SPLKKKEKSVDSVVLHVPGTTLEQHVPIKLSYSNTPAAGPAIALDQTGVRFAVRQGSGTPLVQGIRILNIGAPGTTLHWHTKILQGSDWLTLTTTSGTATAASRGVLVFGVSDAGASGKPVGPSYALVAIISDQGTDFATE